VSATSESANKASELDQRMAALEVRATDLEESFVRSGGPGGQNVNKTSSCVMLLHRPSGLRVKCQTSRYQGVNRALALEMLLNKIEQMRNSRVAAEKARIEKARRQNLKRTKGSKERMLAAKSRQSEKKRLRGSVRDD
jgi:protein subunit release factor B